MVAVGSSFQPFILFDLSCFHSFAFVHLGILHILHPIPHQITKHLEIPSHTTWRDGNARDDGASKIASDVFPLELEMQMVVDRDTTGGSNDLY